MPRSALLWGTGLILLGAFLLLDQLGFFRFDLSALVFPGLLIVLGGWIIWSTTRQAPELEDELSIPLDPSSGPTCIELAHSAGRLRILPDAAPGTLLEGRFDAGVKIQVDRTDRGQVIKLSHAQAGYPFRVPWAWWKERTPTWEVHLSKEVPLELVVRTQAAEARADLRGLRLTRLEVAAQAASGEFDLPAPTGNLPVRLRVGAGSVLLRLPTQAQARIRDRGSLSETRVDSQRFSERGDGRATLGFASATDRFDIESQADLGSVVVQ
jgi:hypothetical protein